MDEALTPALLRAIDRAETECGIHQTRLRKAVEARGGMAAAREYLRKGRASDGFDALAAAGHTELTMEALVVSGQFNALFTDEEVNFCFSLLCGADYFGKIR